MRRTAGERIGTIEREMIDRASGRVAYAVMSFGGFLGIGEKYLTLPWSVLRFSPELDAFHLDPTDEQFRDSPRRTETGGDPSDERTWEESIHRSCDATPSWGF